MNDYVKGEFKRASVLSFTRIATVQCDFHW
jgi:hypothetical protein